MGGIMPVLQIDSGPDGPRLNQSLQPLTPALRQALQGSGPIVIMIHGYKFDPRNRETCPHRHILSLDPSRASFKAVSWPRGLGFDGQSKGEGVAIAFGWPARGTIWKAYERAAIAGRALAGLIETIGRLAPGRRVHLLAHSLGARVALTALPHVSAPLVDRMILMSGADYGQTARTALQCSAGQQAQIINVTSRENDLFDFLLERLVAPPERGDRTLAHGMPQAPNTLTLQLDHRETLGVLRGAGFDIAPPGGRVCHWSSYIRQGVFPLYRALLRQPEDWPLIQLRAALPKACDPRWSRIWPSGWVPPRDAMGPPQARV
jgi:pimeloyl-ACP methyl ester carboxylesterase